MAAVYTTSEARARFSEALRRAREGETVTITHRGEPVAEIKPIARAEKPSDNGGGNRKRTIEDRLEEMRRAGTLQPSGYPKKSWGEIKDAAAQREPTPGALNRFLAERWHAAEEDVEKIQRGESLGEDDDPNLSIDERLEKVRVRRGLISRNRYESDGNSADAPKGFHEGGGE